LKDFGEPVAIFQLGSERFPPLKTISNTNLPRPVSSFVGREREVGELVALVGDGARLVTLSGPGGSGKTRLSIAAAADLFEVVASLRSCAARRNFATSSTDWLLTESHVLETQDALGRA
jgi:hypothetical protein